jgi:signal transduction histidine kinase
MLNDRVVIVGLLAVAGYVSLYAAPLLATEQMEYFSQHLGEPPLLFLVTIGLLLGLRRTRHVEERRFWGFFGACFAIWLTGTMLNSISVASDSYAYLWIEPAVDSLFLLSYLACFIAIDQRPHLETGWSRKNVSYAFTSLGTLLFVGGLVTYFFIFPFLFEGGFYSVGLSTYLMIIALDALIALRLFMLAESTPDGWWRRAYGLLALAASVWIVTDSIEWLIHSGRLELAYGTPWDFLWYAPFLVFFFVRRARDLEAPPEASSSLRDRAVARPEGQPDAPVLLLVYAFFFPAVHLGLATGGLIVPQGSFWRDTLVLFCLLAFLALAVGHQRLLARRNRELRSAISVMVSNEQMQQAQKMEAIGRLAGGVAHDFNNLLMVIQGNASLVCERLDGESVAQGQVEEITRAAERASWLTRQLLAFSRGQVLHPQTVDLAAVVNDAESMLRRLLGERVEVVTAIDAEGATVKVDPSQVLQVILNLAVNARDAMPDGGRLTLRLSRERLDRPDIDTQPPAQPGDYVVLSAVDTGSGMDEETRARVFEPFFTGKRDGTGLGLATVYGIVAQSDGFIRVLSTEGRGSTFQVYLPHVEQVAAVTEAPAVPSAAAAQPPPQRLTVLLVEDDTEVRQTVQQLLDALGFDVIETRNAEEAIEFFEHDGSAVDMLMTDIVMPGVNGWQLAEQLKRFRPALKVLFVSGYSEAEMGELHTFGENELFLQKPFTLVDLEQKLEALFGVHEMVGA